MKTEIKVISVIAKVSKKGEPYSEVWCEVTIGDRTFVKKFFGPAVP